MFQNNCDYLVLCIFLGCLKFLLLFQLFSSINFCAVIVFMPVDINNLTDGWLELESDPGE